MGEFQVPCQVSMPGDLELGERASRALGIEGQWGLCEGASRDWRKWRLILERHTQAFMSTGSQGKAEIPEESGSDLPEDLLGKQGETWFLLGKGHWRQRSRE